jgi:hypothetical protein
VLDLAGGWGRNSLRRGRPCLRHEMRGVTSVDAAAGGGARAQRRHPDQQRRRREHRRDDPRRPATDRPRPPTRRQAPDRYSASSSTQPPTASTTSTTATTRSSYCTNPPPARPPGTTPWAWRTSRSPSPESIHLIPATQVPSQNPRTQTDRDDEDDARRSPDSVPSKDPPGSLRIASTRTARRTARYRSWIQPPIRAARRAALRSAYAHSATA